MDILYEVMTFAEANEYLGKSNQYMYDLVKANKLVEGKDYRVAGRVKLVKKEVVERLKATN